MREKKKKKKWWRKLDPHTYIIPPCHNQTGPGTRLGSKTKECGNFVVDEEAENRHKNQINLHEKPGRRRGPSLPNHRKKKTPQISLEGLTSPVTPSVWGPENPCHQEEGGFADVAWARTVGTKR